LRHLVTITSIQAALNQRKEIFGGVKESEALHLKVGGSCLPLTAINEALEAAAQIADRGHASEIANQIRALKWEAKITSYASEIQTARNVA
jgi:hypothetical protein